MELRVEELAKAQERTEKRLEELTKVVNAAVDATKSFQLLSFYPGQ